MNTTKFYNMNTSHHLYNRGANKNKIFLEDADYSYFIKKMKLFKEKYSIRINCYCLMPNHFHLFVKQRTAEKSTGKFIGDLTNTFTKGMNKKYDRSGVLFQGRTKSKLISNEEYFLWLCKYILNNPVSAGLVNKPEEWRYSSAQEYFSTVCSDITETKEILERFKSRDEFISFISFDKREFDYSLLF